MSGLGPNRRLVSHRIFVLLLMAGAIAGVLARPAVAAQPPASLTAWIAADFDGDRKPDLAHAGSFHSDGRGFVQEISLRFSAFESGTFSVRTPGVAYRLVARDVDGDSDRDLILETLFREPLAILLNDGEGHFHEGRLEDFASLFAHRERCSWETPGRRTADFLARDASQNYASVVRPSTASTELAAAGEVERRETGGSSAILHNPSTRRPPAS